MNRFVLLLWMLIAHCGAFTAQAQQRPDTTPMPKAVMPTLKRPATTNPARTQTTPASRPKPVTPSPARPATATQTPKPRQNPVVRPTIPRAVNLQNLPRRPDTAKPRPRPVVVAPRPTARQTDSLRNLALRRSADSATRIAQFRSDSLRKDSVARVIAYAKASEKKAKDSLYGRLLSPGSTGWNLPVKWQINALRAVSHTELLFYILAGLCFVLALIKSLFPKYFMGLFAVVFQTSFRQKQTRDVLTADKLPSLLMNLFFVLTLAMLLALLNQRLQWIPLPPQWVLLYAIAVLGLIYIIKFSFIALSGWAFEAREAAGAYAFVVGLVNKAGAVLLLPLVLVYAFAGPKLTPVLTTVFIVLGIALLLYRYLMAVTTLRGLVRINLVHFLVYICAVEVLPLLIMYKVFTHSVMQGNYLALVP